MIVFNLDEATLDGYRAGSIAPKEFNNDHYQNIEEGYTVYVVENRISGIVVFYRADYRGFKNFRGQTIANRGVRNIGSGTTRNEIEAILGPPTSTWNDGVEMNATYRDSDHEVEVIWNLEHRSLDYIAIEPVTQAPKRS